MGWAIWETWQNKKDKIRNSHMKKFWVAFAAVLFFPVATRAQFHITPIGVKAEDGKDYYVVEFDSMTRDELYSRAKRYVMTHFNSPNDVMSETKPEMLTIHSFHNPAFYAQTYPFLGKVYSSAFLTITLHFKDGRMRIDAPSASGISDPYVSVNKEMSGGIHMFKKNGAENEPKVIESFNRWINAQVSSIVGFISSEETGEDDW